MIPDQYGWCCIASAQQCPAENANLEMFLIEDQGESLKPIKQLHAY